MSTKYKIKNPYGIYFMSFAVVEWVDVFTRPLYCHTFISSLKYCQDNKGLILYAWCLMSNHVHLIASSKNGKLSDIMRDLKKYTSYKILKEIQANKRESRKDWMLPIFKKAGYLNSNNRHYQFWRQDNQPKELLPFENSFMMQKLNYLHMNPVHAGIVEKPEDYLYSSARNYANLPGLLDVEYIR